MAISGIYVIAGHGAGDPGACANGFQEAERVRVLAQRIADFGGDKVKLHPFSKNAYADKAISSLGISKEWAIVELHMDSAAGSARGGHVIINSAYDADAYDKALAALMADMFPGRAQTIVKRGNLGNCNRAKARGYNYRLVENGFISNADDLATFNGNVDELAKGYLAAFGIGVRNAPSGATSANAQAKVDAAVKKGDVGGNAMIAKFQEWLNETYGAGLKVDGYDGPNTRKASVRALQHELNVQFGKGLAEDGIWGKKTCNACVNVRKGAKGNITRILQGRLICKGYGKGGFDSDFGSSTAQDVGSFQSANGLKVDEVAGRNTFAKLMA